MEGRQAQMRPIEVSAALFSHQHGEKQTQPNAVSGSVLTYPNELNAAAYSVPLCVSHICLTKITLVRLATTARPPAASIPMALIFFLSGKFVPQTSGIGTIRTAKSVTLLMIVSDRYITLISKQVAFGYGVRSQ